MIFRPLRRRYFITLPFNYVASSLLAGDIGRGFDVMPEYWRITPPGRSTFYSLAMGEHDIVLRHHFYFPA